MAQPPASPGLMQLTAIGVGQTGEVRVGHRADERGVANRSQPVKLRLLRGPGDLPDGEAGEQAVELEALVNDGSVEGRDPEPARRRGRVAAENGGHRPGAAPPPRTAGPQRLALG
jgi:hypothetical protein